MQPNDPNIERQEIETGDMYVARKLRQFASRLHVLLARRSTRDGQAESRILYALSETLMHLLDLRFVFARLHPVTQGAPRDHLSITSHYRDRTERSSLAAALEPWLARAATSDLSPGQLRIGAETVTLTSLSSRSKIIP